MTDLLDLPIHQLVRDAEVEPEFRSRSRSRYRNDRPVFMGGSNRFSSGIINGNSSIPVPDPNRISGNPNARIPVIGNSSTRPGTAATSKVASGATPFPNPLPPPPLVTAETKIFLPPKEKRAVFLVDDKGMIKWYRYLSESFESYQFSMFTPVNYMIRDQDEWQFLHYDESIILDPINKIEPTDYNLIRFSLLGISEKGIRTQSVQTVCLVGTRFFKPMLWKKGIYVMPFINNARSISGLAVLDMDPKKLKD